MSTATKTRIGPADHGRKMSLAEFLDAETVDLELIEREAGQRHLFTTQRAKLEASLNPMHQASPSPFIPRYLNAHP